MVEFKGLGIALAVFLLLAGCGSGYRKHVAIEERKQAMQEKVEVEAYLFDARLRRRGKPTSFRLEIFQTDSVLALGGRAYLGKGALKGRMTADSLEVYFPSSNEYLYELLSDLFTTVECPNRVPDFNLLSLFDSLPDSIEEMENVRVTADYGNSKRPEFNIFLKNCPWRIELTYDQQGTGWRIRSFVFDDGQGVSLIARRREYKKRARVPSNKFQVLSPSDAVRIIP